MSSIGATLREARIKRSLSLEEVHSKIKIHPRVLTLLEDDKFDRLPSPMFVKSFLKSYAEFLEVNPEELLSGYQKMAQKSPDQLLFIRSADERDRQRDHEVSSSMSKILWAVAAGAAIAAVITFAAANLKHLPKINLNLKPIGARQAQAPAATAPAHNAAAKTKVTEAAARKSVEWLRSVTAGNYPAIDKRASLDLRIKALDSVWLRITSDSKVLYQGILKKGQAEGWSAKETIEVWTGNASNIYLTLNRQTLGSPGRGVIKRMIITHQGIRISPSEARGQ